MMISILWSWISGVCRQKRILLLLCTFASSFILFNYAILSSSTYSLTTVHHHTKKVLYNDKDGSSDAFTTIKRLHQDENQTGLTKQKRLKLQSSFLQKKERLLRESESYSDVNQFTKVYKRSQSQSFQESYVEKSSHAFPQQPNVIFIKDIANSSSVKTNRINTDEVTEDRNDDYDPNETADLYTNSHYNHQKTDNNQSSLSPLVESISLNNNLKSITNFSVITPFQSSNSIKSSPIQYNQKFTFPETSPLKSPTSISSSTLTSIFPALSTSTNSSQYINKYENYADGISNNNNSNSTLIPPFSSIDFMPYTSTKTTKSPFRIPPCPSPAQLRRVQKRKKNLTVIENFIMGWNRVKCNETITYTTHGDYRYLDNVVPLVERWNGPISISIYAPGTDMMKTLRIISYLKMCATSKIDEWVTFHLIYDVKFSTKPATQNYSKPGDILWLDTMYKAGKWRDCSKQPSFSKFDFTFRIENKLLYPINIARNIARSAATTYYVLASDIELYPSINLIPKFMKMLQQLEHQENNKKGSIISMKNKFTTAAGSLVAKLFSPSTSTINKEPEDSDNYNNELIGRERNKDSHLHSKQGHSYHQQRQHNFVSDHKTASKHVFVLPVFEVKKDILPCQMETKEQLLSLLRRKAAVIFHHSICPQCHTFPRFSEWQQQQTGSHASTFPVMKTGLDKCPNQLEVNASSTVLPIKIFHKAKRKFPYHLWEPIFIGTKEEPIYDERLSWEGLRDKMVSGYVMCALNYDFYILDNAFLVHKPGIRKVVHLVTKTVMSQDRLINYRIRSELLRKFGKHNECAL